MMQEQQQPTFGIFVGDLDLTVDENDLIQFFSMIGPVVKAKVIRNHSTNISKRYGFVHFPEASMQEKAIAEMNGQMLKGQIINVRSQHYKETDRCLVKRGTKGTDIYIGNIPKNMSKQELYAETQKWGLPAVSDVRIFKNDSGQFCFVTFANEQDVNGALEMLKDETANRKLGGRAVLVQQQQQSPGGRNQSNKSSFNSDMFRSNTSTDVIQQTITAMKQLLGGDMCPLNDRQLSLLEKSQRTLYVRNLNPKTTEAALRERFAKYGSLRKVIIVADRDTKVPMGYGFVEFSESHACSTAALEEDGLMDGQQLTLQVSRPPKEVHAIISAAGLCDESGCLLPQFNPNHQVVPAQTYFQCPKTGQLFIGDAQHAQHYISQGYVHVGSQAQTLMQQTTVQQQQQQQMAQMHQQQQFQQQKNTHGGAQNYYGANQGYQAQPQQDQRNSTNDYQRGNSWHQQQDQGQRQSNSHHSSAPSQGKRFSAY